MKKGRVICALCGKSTGIWLPLPSAGRLSRVCPLCVETYILYREAKLVFSLPLSNWSASK